MDLLLDEVIEISKILWRSWTRMSLFILLIETEFDPLEGIEEPGKSLNALNGNALNLGNTSFLLFSKYFSSAASSALWESLFSVPKF